LIPKDDPPLDKNNKERKEKKKNNPTGLRNVIYLGLVSFFTDFSTEMILGILPLFIVNNLGASRALLGVIDGSAELFSYTFKMVSGSLSDKLRKRKIFILIGYGLSTISKPFFAVTSGWLDAFIIRAADRIGKGVRTSPRDALIADSVSESISGKAFGIHRTIDQAGAIVGPITAYAILQSMNIQWVFLFSLIPGAIAVIILIFFVKEVMIEKKSSMKTTFFSNIKLLIKENKPFAFFLVVSGIFGLGAFNFSFVLLKASSMGIDEKMIPIVYAIINLSHTLISIPAGILADRIGKEKVLIMGYFIFIISLFLMVFLTGNYLYGYIIALIFGLYVGIMETIQRAVIPKFIPSKLRGTGFGLYYIITGIAFFICNTIFGFLWDNYTFNIAIYYSLGISFAAIFGMIVFIKTYSNTSIKRMNG
jgi:MFS family permease